MTNVVSVKFKGRGKTYYFDPNGIEVPEGKPVVVETSKGLELAECVQGNHIVTDERIVPPLRPVVRLATPDDLRIAELCKAREKEAFSICEKKIAEHKLDMKLVDVECNFEGNKILFFFTSEGRVDFRELVKDLASVFRTRIELRQIGVRDEAKMLGGLGICGRPFCCHQFLDDFQPVSTKMAKIQSLSLNPAKISGSCGRLMCCLRYEQEAYEELVKTVPKNGAFVETPCGYGNVCQVNLLRQKVKVKLDGSDETPKGFDADEVAAVPGGRPKPGEPLPHVLELKPKVKEEEPESEDSLWTIPPMFAEDTAEPRKETSSREPAGEEKKKSGSSRRRSRHKKSSGASGDKPQDKAAAQEKGKTQEKSKPQSGQNGQGAQPAQGGEKKRSGSRRRRGGSGGQGGQNAQSGQGGQNGGRGQQPKAQNGGGASRPQNEGGRKPQEKKSAPRPQEKKPAAPGGEAQTRPQGEGGEKRSGSSRRRHRSKSQNKPAAPGGNAQAKSE